MAPGRSGRVMVKPRRECQVVLFRLLPQELAAKTFAYLGTDQQKRLLKAMGQQEIAELLNVMSDDDRTALLEELPANVVAIGR